MNTILRRKVTPAHNLAVVRCYWWTCSHSESDSAPMPIFFKFKCLYSASKSDFSLGLSLDLFLILKYLSTVNATRVFIPYPSSLGFLAPVYLPWPPLLWSDDQVNFMDLDCYFINLHKFISCPGPCIGKVDLFLLLFWSSSKVFCSLVWQYCF